MPESSKYERNLSLAFWQYCKNVPFTKGEHVKVLELLFSVIITNRQKSHTDQNDFSISPWQI